MGTEFNKLFDEWSEHYDQTVTGHDVQYKEVFDRYDDILNAVAARASGTVVEFGVGTGNLTQKLLAKGLRVYGIEPSAGMRAQFGKRQLAATLLEGDFLDYPAIEESIDTIVSTYAFHHLTDEEKGLAIAQYAAWLGDGGKIIFADTAFQDEAARHSIETAAEAAGYMELLNDLRTEYYTTLDVLESLFKENGFHVSFHSLNRYVWLMEAVKVKPVES
ncbi:class I SAM-dependent DNA methyltransferase [Paenibacillus sp. 2TAB19]|uniref:class I SAM-dependent DNA methyltransferase n=1 Tax=Paenibacillus sp. 2TAB19 TaxID=3233003 RepID=UPI003F9D73C6